MKLSMSSISSTSLLFACSCYFFAAQVNAGCNHDNCLRAVYPTGTPTAVLSASIFCAAYTTAIFTATTGFPARFSSQCSNNPSRVSSACSCQPTGTTTITTTTSPTPTPCTVPGNAVINGDFECGLSPWVPAATPGTTYALTSPGEDGQFAFEVDQNVPPDTSTGREQASINQDLNLAIGQTYLLTFYSYFDVGDNGFIGVMLNHRGVYTVDSEENGGQGTWNQNQLTFTPAVTPFNLRFEFLFGATGVDKIDNISVVPSNTENTPG